jgi:glutathione synthase/RimK-type ligase-like ATP-grasp enzyme
MKLILAHNQTEQFVNFYDDLKSKSDAPFDYVSYYDLLFSFMPEAEVPLSFEVLTTGKNISDYDGVYINNYLDTYEIAASAAITCKRLGIDYVNEELSSPVSMSKLSMYSKLAAGKVTLPKSYGGAKLAIIKANDRIQKNLAFPVVLKRADADRGIDNFKVANAGEIAELLKDHDNESLWIIQEYVENDGFYLVSFYNDKPAFSIYRTLEERADKDEHKAHMFKPFGGRNASLVEIGDLPGGLVETTTMAVKAMNRQIASVDCIYDPKTEKTYVLEVNYNPQLVTIETFKDARVKAFLDNLKNI